MMKKNIFIFLIVQCIAIISFAQSEIALIDSSFFLQIKAHPLDEYTFDKCTDPSKWGKQKPGLHVTFGSTDEAYFRTEVPGINEEAKTWESSGWRGERLNAMILTWSPDTLEQIRFVINDLKNEKGNFLSKKNLQVNMIRYVLSNYPYDAKDASCDEGPTNKAYLMPDRFESFERFEIPGQTVRPVWLSINIPSETIPGVYTGTIEVRSDKGSATLNLKVKVQDQILPKPHDWTFHLDLWQNPWITAHYYGVKPWSDEHKAILKKHLKLYADAGGKFITTYAVYSPWADATYRPDEGMIEWIKRKNGMWKFDYSIFDQYVELAMSVGIDKAITIYTPIPWGERFRYLDETTGNYVYERWQPTSDTFKTNWKIFLTDLRSHLEMKGWFNKTYLGINENAMEQTLSAIKVIRDHSKQWKITYAGDWHPELDSLLNDYSCVFNKEPEVKDVKKRKAKKRTSTFYICCTPPKPNTFVFSPPVEGRWLGWYALAHDYDGMLRWAYDSWTADPLHDARHIYWGAGDCFMVYPGGNSSVRFEKMREGIVDFEKIKMLRSEVAGSFDPTVKKLLKELEQHLQSFNMEKEFKSEKLRNDLEKGKQLINELSERLKR